MGKKKSMFLLVVHIPAKLNGKITFNDMVKIDTMNKIG